MIPKVEACLASLEAGVKKAHIVDGPDEAFVAGGNVHTTGVGTEIVLKAEPVNGGPRSASPDRIGCRCRCRAGRTAELRPVSIEIVGWVEETRP